MRDEARAYYDKKLKGFSDAEDRLFKRILPIDKSHIKKVHLVGVCGTAMGSLASLLKQSGYKVTGSDTHCYPPMSDLIASLGIEFFEGFSENNLMDADVIVVGNICEPNNIEAKYARMNKKPTLSIGEAIHFFFLEGKKSISVSGTHGKTTTTGLLAHVLSESKMDPGFLIGGVMNKEEDNLINAKIGEGQYFVIEGDEYDTAYFDKAPKFLHYDPYISIVTSLEFDHADIYEDFEKYKDAFKFLVQEVKSDGAIFLCGDDENVRALGELAEADVYYYGLNENNDIKATNIQIMDNGQTFELIHKEELIGEFTTTLFGKHNLLNTLAVCGAAIRIGISVDDLRKGLANFSGMKRRQEVVFDKDITIIDDFAHHPTAVLETISAIRSKYPDRRMIVFFEPRSVTSRKKIFQKDYGEAFDESDLVFVSTPILKSVDDPEDFIDPEQMIINIRNRGVEAYSFNNADELLIASLSKIKKNDVVLIMSNGSFDGIHKKLAESFIV